MATASLLLCVLPAGAAQPSVGDALKLQPTQRRVEIDRPSDEQSAACTISVKRDGDVSGWLVKSPSGAPLRWFADSNGDNFLDRWSYYKDGLEVYRDIDTDFNRQVDQCRWYHSAGTRWGIDANEDGVIDRWKTLSAEELSEEVVEALARGDASGLQSLVLSSQDIDALELESPLRDRLREGREETTEAISMLVDKQTRIPSDARWVAFQGSRPGLIPVATTGGDHGVRVRERAVAIVELENQLIQVDLGPLIQVGDAWRIVQAPRVISEAGADQASRSEFFFPSTAAPMANSASAGGSDYQELLSQLVAADHNAVDSEFPSSHAVTAGRADLLEQLAARAPDAAERDMWTRQLADTLLAAVQLGEFSAGVTRLDAIAKHLESQPQQKSLAAYVRFRHLTADYAASLQGSDGDDRQQRVHEERLKSLERFVEAHPDSEDAAEAMLQLGLNEEFAGRKDNAAQWYRSVVRRFGTTPPAEKAAGALLRLESMGKQVSFQGRLLSDATLDLDDHRGKFVLLQYWATWSPPSTEQIPALAELAKQYAPDQLRIIGVNLDGRRQDVLEYLAQHPVSWPTVYEPGGMDSPPANHFGIFTAPMLILIDREGKLVKHGSALLEMETWIREQIPETSSGPR